MIIGRVFRATNLYPKWTILISFEYCCYCIAYILSLYVQIMCLPSGPPRPTTVPTTQVSTEVTSNESEGEPVIAILHVEFNKGGGVGDWGELPRGPFGPFPCIKLYVAAYYT